MESRFQVLVFDGTGTTRFKMRLRGLGWWFSLSLIWFAKRGFVGSDMLVTWGMLVCLSC